MSFMRASSTVLSPFLTLQVEQAVTYKEYHRTCQPDSSTEGYKDQNLRTGDV